MWNKFLLLLFHQAQEKGVAAVFVGLVRGMGHDTASIRSDDLYRKSKGLDSSSCILVDPDELNSTEAEIDEIKRKWSQGALSDWEIWQE